MYAADHDALFKAVAGLPAAPEPVRLADVDFDALIARGRAERAREFANFFNQAVAAMRRLTH